MHDKKRCNLELNENRRYPKGGPLEKQGGGRPCLVAAITRLERKQ
jgi:hypothetical protein